MYDGLVSVIIPVYNVEKYLIRCVESVLNQTYENIEIILVDDGSTDGSSEMCDDFARKYEKITVIHQKNQGLGPARNSGLNIAKGEYIAFVDSDDWIAEDMYLGMVEAMEDNDCEIATCGRAVVTDEGIAKHIYCSESEKVLTKETAIQHYLLQQDMNMSACDKLFKSSLFDGIRFPGEYLVSEDIVPIYMILKKTSRVVLTGKPYYNYYYRLGSISKSAFSRKLMGAVIYSREVAHMVKRDFPQMDQESEFFLIDSIVSTYRSMQASGYSGAEKNELLFEMKSNFFKALGNKYLYKRHKIYICLAVLKIDSIPNIMYRKYKEMCMR